MKSFILHCQYSPHRRICKCMPNLQRDRFVIVKQLANILNLKNKSEIFGVFIWLTFFSCSDSGYLDKIQVLYTLAHNIRHKIIQLVECNCRRESLSCIIDFCCIVKILFDVIFLYKRNQHILVLPQWRVFNIMAFSNNRIIDDFIRILFQQLEKVKLLDTWSSNFLYLAAFFQSDAMRLQCPSYLHGNMVGKINRHSVSDHLIAIIHIVVNELVIIGEGLYSCHFTHRHSSVKMLLPWHKDMMLRINLLHLRCLWMQLTLPTACLYGETLLIPTAHTIARHEDGRIATYIILMIRHSTSFPVCVVMCSCRDGRILQISYCITQSEPWFHRSGVFEIMDVQILSESNEENAVSVLWHFVITSIQHFQIDVIASLLKRGQKSLHCFSIPFFSLSLNLRTFSSTKSKLS